MGNRLMFYVTTLFFAEMAFISKRAGVEPPAASISG
jgi:hypothetical protein